MNIHTLPCADLAGEEGKDGSLGKTLADKQDLLALAAIWSRIGGESFLVRV
jgi:hypothetical protein